jgi:hypothetical protein
MHKNLEQLMHHTMVLLNMLLAGYTKLPSQAECNNFFTKMMALCQRMLINAVE